MLSTRDLALTRFAFTGGQILKSAVAKRLKQLVECGQLSSSSHTTTTTSKSGGVASYEFSEPVAQLRGEWHRRLSALQFNDAQEQKLITEAQLAFTKTFESLPQPRAAL